MAHFVVEYSDNLSADSLDLPTLFERLHRCAADSGIFPLKGIRSRAYACRHYHLADGNPEHAFIHLEVLIGPGRPTAQRQQMANTFFEVLSAHTNALFRQRGVMLSFNLQELSPDCRFNRNNIQEYL